MEIPHKHQHFIAFFPWKSPSDDVDRRPYHRAPYRNLTGHSVGIASPWAPRVERDFLRTNRDTAKDFYGDFTGFYWDLLGFDWDLLGFYWDLTRIYLDFNGI